MAKASAKAAATKPSRAEAAAVKKPSAGGDAGDRAKLVSMLGKKTGNLVADACGCPKAEG